MATSVIDALVLELGFDASKLQKGQRDAQASIDKTKDSFLRSGKQVEEAVNRTNESIASIAKAGAAAFAAITLGGDLKQFVAGITAADAAIGRLGRNIGIDARTLTGWGVAASEMGGSADATAASFAALNDKIQALKTYGEALPPVFYQIRAQGGKQIDINHGLNATFLDLAQNLKNIADKYGPERASFMGRLLGIDDATVNLLIQGRDIVKDIIDKKGSLGPSADDIKRAQELQKLWADLMAKATQVGRHVLNDLNEPLKQTLDDLDQWVTKAEHLWSTLKGWDEASKNWWWVKLLNSAANGGGLDPYKPPASIYVPPPSQRPPNPHPLETGPGAPSWTTPLPGGPRRPGTTAPGGAGTPPAAATAPAIAPPVGGAIPPGGPGAGRSGFDTTGGGPLGFLPTGVPYDAAAARTAMGVTQNQWEAFREGLHDIERGVYGGMGGAGGRFAGRYQMGAAEIAETAARLGVPAPTTQQFLADPTMQERFFENYTIDHYNRLMQNPRFAGMSVEQRMQVLGYAHNQGVGGAQRYLNTGQAGADAWGTSGTAYFDPIHRRFAQIGQQPPAGPTPSRSAWSPVGSANATPGGGQYPQWMTDWAQISSVARNAITGTGRNATTTNNSSSDVSIGSVTIQSQATDAAGLARDFAAATRRQFMAAQGNYGPR